MRVCSVFGDANVFGLVPVQNNFDGNPDDEAAQKDILCTEDCTQPWRYSVDYVLQSWKGIHSISKENVEIDDKKSHWHHSDSNQCMLAGGPCGKTKKKEKTEPGGLEYYF